MPTPEEIFAAQPPVKLWEPPPTPPVPLPELISDERFKNAPIETKNLGVDNWFKKAAPFAKNDSESQKLWDTKIALKDRVLDDHTNEFVAKDMESKGFGQQDAEQRKKDLIEYDNRTGGRTHDPIQTNLRGEKLPPLRIPDDRQLTDLEIDRMSLGDERVPAMNPTDRQRLEYTNEVTKDDSRSGRVDKAFAEVASNKDGGITAPDSSPLTKRDLELEKRNKPFFDSLDERKRLWKEKSLSKWFVPSEARAETGDLFALRRKPDVTSNTWQVRLGQGSNNESFDVTMPDGVDFSSEDGAKAIKDALHGKVRENLDKFNDEKSFLSIGGNGLSARDYAERSVGAANRGFWGEANAMVGDPMKEILFQGVIQPIADIAAAATGRLDAELKSSVPAFMLGQHAKTELPELSKDGDPNYGFWERAAIGAKEMVDSLAVARTYEDNAAGNGWGMSWSGKLPDIPDASMLAHKAVGIAEMVAQFSNPVGVATVVGQSISGDVDRFHDDAINRGLDPKDALAEATRLGSITGLIKGGLMIGTGKVLTTDALASEGIRKWFAASVKANPGKVESLMRNFAGSTVASLATNIPVIAAGNTVGRVASAIIHDAATGSEMAKPLVDLFSKGDWDNFKASEFGEGLKEDLIYSGIFGVAHGVGGARKPLKADELPDYFERLSGRKQADGTFRNSYSMGDHHVVFAKDGRMVRFSEQADAEAFHDVMAKHDAEMGAASITLGDGSRVWRPDVPDELKTELTNREKNIQADIHDNVTHHAFLNSTEVGVGMHDTLSGAMAHARELASKIVLNDQRPVAEQRRSFVDQMENDYINRAQNWNQRRKDLIASHGERTSEWPAAKAKIEGEIDSKIAEITNSVPGSPEQEKLLHQLTDLQKSRMGIIKIVKTYTPEEAANTADAVIRVEKEQLRRNKDLRRKAEQDADAVFNPQADFVEGALAPAGTTADLQTASVAQANAINKHFAVERKSYTGSDGVERIGYELRFRGPMDPAERIKYEVNRSLSESEGRARKVINEFEASKKAAFDAGLMTAEQAAGMTTTPRDAAKPNEQMIAEIEAALAGGSTVEAGKIPSGGKSAEKSAAFIGEKLSERDAKIQATLDRLKKAESERAAAEAAGPEQWKNYADNAAKGSVGLAETAKDMPENKGKNPIEFTAKLHGQETAQKALEADIPAKALKRAKKALETQKKALPAKPQDAGKGKPADTPLKSEKMSDNLKVLADLAKSPDFSVEDVQDHLASTHTKDEIGQMADEMGLQTKSAKILANEAVKKFRQKDTKTEYKPSEDDGNDIKPSDTEVTVDDLIANEDEGLAPTKKRDDDYNDFNESEPIRQAAGESIVGRVESIFSAPEMAQIAKELGHQSWTSKAKNAFVEAYADWVVTAKAATKKLGEFFAKAKNKLRTLLIGSIIVSSPKTAGDSQASIVRVPSKPVHSFMTAFAKPKPFDGRLPSIRGGEIEIAERDNPRMGPGKQARSIDTGNVRISDDAAAVAEWSLNKNDTDGRPFLIADKNDGSVSIFNAFGKLIKKAPALFGKIKGDRLDDNVTPAGRFEAGIAEADPSDYAYGKTLDFKDNGEAVLAVHRVYLEDKSEARQQRLDSPDAGDNRISHGCINVPDAIMDSVIDPLFSSHGGVVYVLPETGRGAGFRIKTGKTGFLSNKGSTVIFSEVADRAVAAIKAGWDSAKFVAEAVKEWGPRIAKAAKDVWDHVVGSFAKEADDIAGKKLTAKQQRENFLAVKGLVEATPKLPKQFEKSSPAMQKYVIRQLMTPEQRTRVEKAEAETQRLIKAGQLTETSIEGLKRSAQQHFSSGWKFYDDAAIDWWKRVAIEHPELGMGALATAHFEMAFNGRFIEQLNRDGKGLMKQLRPRSVLNPNGLKPDDYVRFTKFARFAPEKLNELIANDPAFANVKEHWSAWDSPGGARDAILKASRDAGADIGQIDNYFPAVVKDVKGLQEFLSNSKNPQLRGISQEIAEATHGINPGQPEYGDAINKLILSRITTTPKSSSHTKSRKVTMDISDPLVDELVKFYAGPDVAMERYVNRMARNTTIQKFFGSDARSTMATGTVDVTGGGTTIPKSSQIGGVMADLIARGELTPEQQRNTIKLFGDYLNAKPSNRVVRVLKALSTPLVLNNPLGATRQLDGLAVTAINNGMVNTFDGLVKIPEGQRLTLKNQGMQENIQLHSSDAAFPKFTEAVWSISLYRAFDAVEGNTYMNSRVQQIGKMSDSDAMAILQPYQRFLDKPVGQVLAEIRAGKWLGNRDVEYVAFSELSNIRPTSIASQPIALLQGWSAARLAYHLRLFTLQRFNYLREQAMADWKDGNKVRASARTGALVSAIAVAGGTTDEIADWIFGRVGNFKGHVLDQLLKITPFSLNKYSVDQVASGNWKDVVMNAVISIPAMDFVQAMGQTYAKAGKNTVIGDPWFKDLQDTKLLKFVPSVGATQFYYSRFGGGVEARERQFGQAYSGTVQNDSSRWNALTDAGADKRKKNGLEIWYEARKPFMDLKRDADKIAKWHMRNNDISQAIAIANHVSDIYKTPEKWNDERIFYRNEIQALKVREQQNPGTGLK